MVLRGPGVSVNVCGETSFVTMRPLKPDAPYKSFLTLFMEIIRHYPREYSFRRWTIIPFYFSPPLLGQCNLNGFLHKGASALDKMKAICAGIWV